MKVSYLISNIKTSIDHEFDLGIEDSQYLLEELVKSTNPKNRLWVESISCALDFYIEENGHLWVEICSSQNGIWAISEIDLTIGAEMIRIAYEKKNFSESIPTTNRNWDTYTSVNSFNT